MLTIGDLQKRLYNNAYVDVQVDNETLCSWTDEAQVEIAKRYGKVSTEDYTNSQKRERYDLPDDFLMYSEITREGKVYDKFTITDTNQIIFEDDGDFKVHYHRVPAPVDRSDNNAVLEVPMVFHASIVTYLLYKYWSKESEGTPNEEQYAQNFLQQFFQQLEAAAEALHARKTPAGPQRLPYTVDGWFKFAREYGTFLEMDDICAWMDEAQREISLYYGEQAIEEYEAQKDEAKDLPSDFLEVVNVYRSGKPTRLYRITDEDRILFREKGEHSMVYRKIPQEIDREDPEIDVNSLFKTAIATYCAFKYWQYQASLEPDLAELANSYLEKFHQEVQITADRLMRKSRGPKKIRRIK